MFRIENKEGVDTNIIPLPLQPRSIHRYEADQRQMRRGPLQFLCIKNVVVWQQN